MSLQIGTRLAHYEIVEPIGKGGMGEVYRAKDSKLGRDVAIKVLPDEFAENEERLARFRREAKVLASLNHPGIAAIHGFEESGGTHYLVLELVPGETLAERIARGPIPVEDALQIAAKIAEALEQAHEQGIVHRDLKPANIKLTPDDKVKVLDFGLAKAFVDETRETDGSMSPTITRDATRAGVILGTAAYMSPEQAKGKQVDRRADIWAFGAVLYEMLTGTGAFAGEDVSDTLAYVLTKEPNWEALPKRTPSSMRRLLRRCLQKNISDRQQAIGDARIELKEARTEPREALPARSRATALIVMALALITLAATGLALWSLVRSRPPVSTGITRSLISVSPGDVFGLDSTSSLAISPDGQHIAYVARRGNSKQIYLRSMEALEGAPIDGTEGARFPFFSPDSQWLSFRSDEGLMKKVSVSGGAPVTVTDRLARGASWGLAGEIVYTPGAVHGLSRVSADGGEPEELTVPDRARNEKSHRLPDVLPGGEAVVFTIGTDDLSSWDDASIALLSLETGEHRTLFEGGMNARYVASGHLLYARDGSLLAVPFDLDALEVTGAPVTVLEGMATSSIFGTGEFSVSRDGSLLYAPGGSWGDDRKVVWVDRDGRTEPMIETPRAYVQGRISPNGRFVALDIEGANRSVWVYDLDRSILTQLAYGSDNHDPLWTPDGRRVGYSSSRMGGMSNLHWLAADGSDEPEQLLPHENLQIPSSWSPDGKLLAFDQHSPGTGVDILLLSMERERSAEPFLQTKFVEARLMFSPNGQWVAYESDESGRLEVYVRPFSGSSARWQVSTDGGSRPVWNPDGRELFYRRGDQMMVVDVETDGELVLGRSRLLFERRSFTGAYEVAPDGRRFIMVVDSESEPPPTHLVLVQNWFEELNRLVPTQ